jgi:hypothetical protein
MDIALPRVALVTPSLNQGRFLAQALDSVHSQRYPHLEHVVVDGGSSDGSREILARYGDRIAWTSGPDGGQYDAINRGFARTGGEVMGWLNSDDLQTPWTLSVVGEIFARFPEVEWLTTLYPLMWDEHGHAVQVGYAGGFNRATFRAGRNLPGGRGFTTHFVQQESTFWRRTLWDRAGGRLDSSLRLAGDFELWLRFFDHAPLWAIGTPLAGFRRHGDQKTAHEMDGYVAEAQAVLRARGGRPEASLAGAVRRLAMQAVGARPLSRLSPRLGRVLARAGLLHEAPVCNWRGEWRLGVDYAF